MDISSGSGKENKTHQGVFNNVSFEWDQGLDDLHIYLNLDDILSKISKDDSSKTKSVSATSVTTATATASSSTQSKASEGESVTKTVLPAAATGKKSINWKTRITSTMTPTHFKLVMKDDSGKIHKIFDDDLFDTIVSDESFWSIVSGTSDLEITFQKMRKASTWSKVFKSQTASESIVMDDQKKIMLERFQQEHPGFDFSQAQFNGTAPDPRKFMDGVKYT